MAKRPALAELAERVGILPAWRPAGRRSARPTSDTAREGLLRALGHEAGDEAAAARSLAALRDAERGRLLEPASVRVPGAREHVRLRARRGTPLEVELALEDGGQRSWKAEAAGALALPALPPGRHRLTVSAGRGAARREGRTVLLAAPETALRVEERLGERRVFGIWTNLYTVRSARNQGFGDLGDLEALVRLAGGHGAAFVGLNPLHATRNRWPDVSPYGPTTRLYRNPLYLDLEAVPELEDAPQARRRLESRQLRQELSALREGDTLDPDRVAALKADVLAALHAGFRLRHRGRGTARDRAFAAYREREGRSLRDFATFQALEEHLAAEGQPRDWRRWPGALRHPESTEVAAFRERHEPEVELHAWIQFELDRQLSHAADAGRGAGLALGLYADLALGSAAGGFDTWAHPGLFLPEVHVGAPPDAYAPGGQDWGFPPLDPHALARDGFAFFARLLRNACAHCGALRIDHILGLFRQWWIPPGAAAADGAYVRFPTRELLAVLALESRRAGTVVIGEDLGTVPPQVAPTLARRGVLSSRVMLFERDRRGRFKPARRYSRRALVTANTHDLPTLPGFWNLRDLAIRHALGQLDDAGLRRAERERETEKRALRDRLVAEGRLDPALEPDARDIVPAVHAFLCSTPAPLVGLSLDDLAGETEPINVPGVPVNRHPSWTRRMRRSLESLADDPQVLRGLAAAASRGGRP